MHPIQEKILEISTSHNLGVLSLRSIGNLVGEKHPQKIKHHLTQLMDKGLLKHTDENHLIKRTESEINHGLVSIPILGSADCGPANIYAEDNITGFLNVSSKLVKYKKSLFVLKAVGNSMNKATINNKNIEDGDYVIVDNNYNNPTNKDYVVSIIDGVCNIKKYMEDKRNKQVVLISESSQDFPPIYIHPNETNYLISGKVIDVVKKPNFN